MQQQRKSLPETPKETHGRIPRLFLPKELSRQEKKKPTFTGYQEGRIKLPWHKKKNYHRMIKTRQF
jgi:hypothetical protein